MTYWPAGGRRGQNPENTAQGHSCHNSICPKGAYMSHMLAWRTRREERSDPSLVCSALGPYFVRQGFCPRPPPAGQYVLYAPLTVFRISGMLYCYKKGPIRTTSWCGQFLIRGAHKHFLSIKLNQIKYMTIQKTV